MPTAIIMAWKYFQLAECQIPLRPQNWQEGYRAESAYCDTSMLNIDTVLPSRATAV